MAFVKLDDQQAFAAWLRLSESLGWGCTTLAGKGRCTVLAVPDTAVEELAERAIGFTALREADLPRHLTAKGLALYRHLRARHPEWLYFNAPLPPAQHVAMTCTVPEAHVERVRQVVERYAPVAFRTTEISLHRISTDPAEEVEAQPMVQAEFVVHRRYRERVVDDLMASGAAGFSRATAISVQSDPDGPPWGGAEEAEGD
jgi:hypothetical protein